MNPPKTLFVTGATAGFGLAIAERFAAAGWRVVGTGRRADRLHALAERLGPAFLPLCFDLRDRAATEAAVEGLPVEFREIDVLVNNAGLALGTAPAHEAALDDWLTMIATNTAGLVTLTRAVLPGMVAARRGHVVNIGSVAGSQAYPGGNVYGATKAFVAQFSANLRADLVGHQIRVTNIEPGLCETEFSLVRFHGDAARAAAVYAGTDPILAEDIAEATWWAVHQPARVNVSRIELMAGAQAAAGFQIVRRPTD